MTANKVIVKVICIAICICIQKCYYNYIFVRPIIVLKYKLATDELSINACYYFKDQWVAIAKAPKSPHM